MFQGPPRATAFLRTDFGVTAPGDRKNREANRLPVVDGESYRAQNDG